MIMKKLPLKIDAIVKSECWTYYKMAIIQTLSNYRAWLAVNMQSYIQANGHAAYGNNGEWYDLSYYSSVLDFNEKSYEEISEDNVIDYIVTAINDGKYIVIYTNYRTLYGNESTKPWYHETLIYGYDEEKQLLISPVLFNGTFIEAGIEYEIFKKAFKQARQYYSENPQQHNEIEQWFYGITEIKPKKHYYPVNIYYEYVKRLEKEYIGGQVFSNVPAGYCEYAIDNCYFYGIVAQLELLEKIKLYTLEDKTKHSVRYILIKQAIIHLFEAIQLFYEGVLWFVEDREISNDDEIKGILIGYEDLIERKKRDALLIEKHSRTKDDSILMRIINHIEENYEIEKELLCKYLSRVKKERLKRSC